MTYREIHDLELIPSELLEIVEEPAEEIAQEPLPRFSVSHWHGERRTLFYVVDCMGDDSDWEIVATTYSRARAEEIAAKLNRRCG